MDLEFLFIGWCYETDCDDIKHDKVWTAIKVGDTYYAGWGARGKTITFKKHDSLHSLEAVMRSKKKKYNKVDAFQLFSIFPYFQEEVEKRLCFCLLSNKIK